MPTRASLPCRQPGCPTLVPESGYCITHRKAVDQARGNSTERGYGTRWRKARYTYLMSHPLCVLCTKDGRVGEATVVDHIIPHRGDQALFWDSANNWQSLCRRHHEQKRQRESMEVR